MMLYGRLLPMAASVGCLFVGGDAFVIGDVSWATAGSKTTTRLFSTESAVPLSREQEIQAQKKKLLKLLGPKTFRDPVLADPITKEAIEITATNAMLGSGGGAPSSIPFVIQSPSNTFRGSSDTYLDLLEPVDESSSSDAADADASPMAAFLRQAIPYIPAPFRGVLSSSSNDEVIPMRDLFTSPAVSFAYERGWRQNFNAAGFPGPDIEATMANDFFASAVARVPGTDQSVLVDMSCATGLFTRRFALSGKYDRVIGCDYSPSMLTEARRRIEADPDLSPRRGRRLDGSTPGSPRTAKSLDLVRLDVGAIPMQDGSVDCLHAGAAMHCWPDLDAACSEIYRVLKPKGRYFATTFLSGYFAAMSSMDGQANTPPSQQAFQYFKSVDTLRDLLVGGGFDEEKITIEVLGSSCVVIRAEK